MESPIGYIIDVITHKIAHWVVFTAFGRPKFEENKVITVGLHPGFLFPVTCGPVLNSYLPHPQLVPSYLLTPRYHYLLCDVKIEGHVYL